MSPYRSEIGQGFDRDRLIITGACQDEGVPLPVSVSSRPASCRTSARSSTLASSRPISGVRRAGRLVVGEGGEGAAARPRAGPVNTAASSGDSPSACASSWRVCG